MKSTPRASLLKGDRANAQMASCQDVLSVGCPEEGGGCPEGDGELGYTRPLREQNDSRFRKHYLPATSCGNIWKGYPLLKSDRVFPILHWIHLIR